MKRQSRILNDNRSFLVQFLDPDDVIDELIQSHLIGQAAKQRLQLCCTSTQEKNQIIVDQLSNCRPGALEQFCRILKSRTRQEYIAVKLEAAECEARGKAELECTCMM